MVSLLENLKIFPAKLSWPEGIDAFDGVGRETISLKLNHLVKDTHCLSEFTNLKRLWCVNVNQEFLENICSCSSIEDLYIDELKVSDIASLTKLKNIKTIHIDTCSKLDSLSELAKLESLRALGITNCKNIHDLQPLSKMHNLQELVIAGGMYAGMKVASFSPLSGLSNLKYLYLANVKAEDESLRHLAELKNLQQLDIANFYSTEEFAWLSGKLNGTYCQWFEPYIELHEAHRCDKCGKNTMVMLTGKSKPSLCKECDADRLAKHVEKFMKAKNAN
jgi:Leucine-rich repeat (LRR) protein